MFDLSIQFRDESTQVAIRLNILQALGSLLRELVPEPSTPPIVVVTDEHVGPLYSATVLDSLRDAQFETLEYRIRPGEVSKSLNVAGEIYQFLAHHAVPRDAVILALGGGVISDLSGFIAATWTRGIKFVICPTTLEADIDASIGGKTAIDVPGAKNLVGAFHQPVLVAVDPACLKTLDTRDIRAGLAESVKHALISSDEFLAWHEANVHEILTLDDATITELIRRNVQIKAAIVEKDTRERTGLRMLLNLGHTIGHAIEACCGFELRHGECVSLGMTAASRLSGTMDLLDDSVVTRVEALLTRFGLPTRLTDPIDTDRIMATIRNDKKIRGGATHFVLLEAVGRPVVRDDVPEHLIRETYESLLP